MIRSIRGARLPQQSDLCLNHYSVDCKIIKTIRRQKDIVKNHTNCLSSFTAIPEHSLIFKTIPKKIYSGYRWLYIVVAEHGPSKIGTLPVAPWQSPNHHAPTLRAATGHLPGTTRRHRRQVGRPVAPGAGHRGHGFHQQKLKHGDI